MKTRQNPQLLRTHQRIQSSSAKSFEAADKVILMEFILFQKELTEAVEYTKGLIAQQLAGMGQGLMDDEAMEDTAKRVLGNQEEAQRIYQEIYSKKLRAFYKETAKIKEKEISYDDFVKLAEKRS